MYIHVIASELVVMLRSMGTLATVVFVLIDFFRVICVGIHGARLADSLTKNAL